MLLSIQNLTKQFEGKPALAGVSFDIAPGEIMGVLGPSGCGKTTLLRIIAGLETAGSGQVLYEGQDIGPIPPHRRDFGLMFQDYALFPHKNVFDNVAFGLRMQAGGQTRRPDRFSKFWSFWPELGRKNYFRSKLCQKPVRSWFEKSVGMKSRHRHASEIQNRVQEMLALVGLAGFERRSVNDLSGGEAQRVALARCLAPQPRLLMLDEPLGSLDRAWRERLMTELRDILKRVGVTALYVTHDQAEAFAIADRVVVMNEGRIEQIGPPEVIYRCPASPFVARFLGLTNLAAGRVLDPGRVDSAWGELAVAPHRYQAGDPVTVLIRPEAASLSSPSAQETPLSSQPNRLRGHLTARTFRGGRYQLRVQPEAGPELTLEVAAVAALPLTPPEPVMISIAPAGVVLLA